MFVQKLHVCTMIHQGLSEILQESRSTSAENMARRSGNVKSAQNAMPFNQTGKLIPRLAAQESIDVIVEPFSLGKINIYIYNSNFPGPE